MCKGTLIRVNNKGKAEKLRFFIFFPRKVLVIREKVVPLQAQIENKGVLRAKTVGYGVMVTLQILVLSFLVRVRVPQHFKIASF